MEGATIIHAPSSTKNQEQARDPNHPAVMNKHVRQAKKFCLCHNLAFDTAETINASRSKQPDLD